MSRRLSICCLSILCISCISAGIIQADQSVINLNHDMELGIPGPGVPGYRLIINRIIRTIADKNPERLYLPQTVMEEGTQCLEIPGYEGVTNYQIELADMYINQDCQIHISFKARIGCDETGNSQPNSAYQVDFRAMPNKLAGEEHYPMLHDFSFTPTTQWQNFTVTYPVKARSNFFTLWIAATATGENGTQNALYLDDLKIERVSDQTLVANQVAVMPTQIEPVYYQNQPITLKFKAAINDQRPEFLADVTICSDVNGAVWQKLPVKFTQLKQLPDGRNVYDADLQLTASRFGAFHCQVNVDQKPLNVIGGDFSILHPKVKHPRYSPGWSIGYNSRNACPNGRTSKPYDYINYRWFMFGSHARSFRVANQAGMSLQRMWGHWRLLEPSKGQWETQIIDPVLKLNEKYDLEPIFVIAGNLTVHGDRQWIDNQIDKGRCSWPNYLLAYHHDENGRGAILPPNEMLGRYLDFAIKHWGKQIDIWELFNEPGIGGFPPKRYLDYLKQTYDTVKAHNPDDIVLGNGVTGDFGMNVIKWCEALNSADPNYPAYLDGVAFHPYAVSMDFEKGHYGLYSQCIADIRSKLTTQKPLWNTECFYLTDARKPQLPWYMNLMQCGANEIQRHILDGMLNGVAGAASLMEDSFVKRDAPVTLPALSQAAVATNTLSWLLKDMQQIQTLSNNQYFRTGLFIGHTGHQSLGFVYDLRPTGSTWKLPNGRNTVQILDLFGNPIDDKQREIELSYEPYFLLGESSAIRSLLDEKNIVSRQNLKLTARTFEDTLYLSGHNVSGVPLCTINVLLEPTNGLRMPNQIAMSFTPGIERQTAIIQQAVLSSFNHTAPLKWRQQSDDHPQSLQQINLLPDTGCHRIPLQDQSPLTLKLGNGSLAKFEADSNALHIYITVKDHQITAAKAEDLWNGDALEVFIDPHPMENIDRADVYQGNEALDIWQYIFAVKPSENQTQRRVMNRSQKSPENLATHIVEQTAQGYTLHATIPWTQILSNGNLGQIIGMDIEVDHVDDGLLTKESLGNQPGRSFQKRLHYPLFAIPDLVVQDYLSAMQNAVATDCNTTSSIMRIDLSSAGNTIPLSFVKGSEKVQAQLADWMGKDNNKRLLVTAPVNDKWQELSFTFLPGADGKININLMAGMTKSTKSWCCFDRLVITDSPALKNGSFENRNEKGHPIGWYPMNQPVLINNLSGAADGKYYVMVHHDNRYTQSISVTKDHPVTILFRAKTPDKEQYFRIQE